MSARQITLADIVREHRRSYADRVALVDGDVRLTWPEVDDRTNRLASSLRASGVVAGDRILWLGQNSFRVYELLIAAAKIGAMVCPGYWRWSVGEMAFAIDDFTPKVVVWQDEEVGETAAKARAEATHEALWLQHDTTGEGSYEDFLAAGAAEDPEPEVDPDTALLVIYTSAITGRQGGSMLSHTNLIDQSMAVSYASEIDHETCFLNSGPMFHIGNFQFYGMPALINGGKNVIVRRVEPEEVLRLIVEERCTRAFLMPPTVASMMELNRDGKYDLSHFVPSLSSGMYEGVAADDSKHGRAGGTGFGQTEITGFVVMRAFGDGGEGNAGRPSPFSRVRILREDLTECEIGEVGEICARGALVHIGYWNRPEINEERWRGGWWHTTDLGRREADGSITFIGTATRMIKSAAENIFPAEVENCLEAHPAVKEAAIIGIPNPRFTQEVKAIVALKPGASVSAEELIEHCKERIASYKKPKTIEFVEALPRTGPIKDYATLDETYGGGNYPGGKVMGPHPGD